MIRWLILSFQKETNRRYQGRTLRSLRFRKKYSLIYPLSNHSLLYPMHKTLRSAENASNRIIWRRKILYDNLSALHPDFFFLSQICNGKNYSIISIPVNCQYAYIIFLLSWPKKGATIFWMERVNFPRQHPFGDL